MAALPSPTQVAGTHSAIYEAYYHQVDPNGTTVIQALDAARFLKKSRLSDVVLSKIWDLSDPTGKGYLDKAGLFVALKLVALAQAGKDINMSNINSETPPPKVGELPKVPASTAPARPAAPVTAAADWSIKPTERDRYSQLFDSLQPSNGLIPGNKVKGVLMESKLPLDTLGKIWDLADQDKDGMLDRHEFIVAMHLVYKALEKHAVPTSLPAELRARPPRPPSRPASRPPSRPPSRPASPQPRLPPRPAPPQSNADLLEGLLDFSPPSAQSQPTMSLTSAPQNQRLQTTWVVTPAERIKYDAMFTAADLDRDGYVSGLEIKHVFLDSGLSQQTLAHIWALCDRSASGKLSRNEFALAMWLIGRAAAGVPPPPALAPDMLPPADLPAAAAAPVAPTLTMLPQASTDPALNLGPQPTPELEAIAKEVSELARERVALEAELAKSERTHAAHATEAHSLQSELDTLTATLKQLENQKGEAQKRLNDLKTQVEKLRSQVSAQEAAAADTEAEVAARRAAALTLKEKQRDLEHACEEYSKQGDEITQKHSQTVIAISQANIKIEHLEQQLRTLTSAVELLESGGPGAAGVLSLAPQHTAQHLATLIRGETPHDALEDDSFSRSNAFGAMNGSGFNSDPFKDDAFSSTAIQPHDPFAPKDSSKDGFGSDPFSKSFSSNNADPFNDNSTSKANDDGGAWEADPFAVLHAPTRASPCPAPCPAPSLPPKHHKTPPPRPKPPQALAKSQSTLDFTEDPFKDYRYEDPYNIEDPFADATDSKRPTSVAGFETDDFFGGFTQNGTSASHKPSGRVSAPPVAYDPFATRSDYKPTLPTISSNNNNSWAAWPNDDWAAEDAWNKPTNSTTKVEAWPSSNTSSNSKEETWKTDNWANKTDNWATDWGGSDQNKNLNETWPSNTLPNKKEKSPKPVKYARSLVHTIGGIGRSKHGKDKKKNVDTVDGKSGLPSEEQQWAWAATESRRLQEEAERRRRQEDAELQLALALSRQEK